MEEVNVGENIKRIRMDRGLDQKHVAEMAGITQPMLCQIERGTKNPSLQTGKMLAEVLKCELDDLLA